MTETWMPIPPGGVPTLLPTPTVPAAPGAPDLNFQASSTVEQLFAALSAAQTLFPIIRKDKTAHVKMKAGGAYEYDYADLAMILAAIRPALGASALCVLQPVAVLPKGVRVTTILGHASGQWMSNALDLPVGDLHNAQDVAGAITYARRYGLCALLGIAPSDEDDDGATPGPKASQRGARARQEPVGEPAPPPDPDAISEAQRKRLFAIGKQHGWSPEAIKRWLLVQGVESTKDIRRATYDDVIAALESAPPVDESEAP